MVFPKNMYKQKFKQKFIEEIHNFQFGQFVADDQIIEFAKKHDIGLSFEQIKGCIRELEMEIGINHRKRLKRIRNEGWLILEPRIQADTAIKEGREKVKIALSKTSQRLNVVDVNQLTAEQQNELLRRTSAIDSLLNIVKHSSVAKPIMRKGELEDLRDCEMKIKRS